MSTALMTVSGEIKRWDGPTPEQIALAKRTVAKGATDDEFALFLHVCQRTGLDPFARQLYCIVRGSGERRKATIQTSIDGFRLIADRTGLCAGSNEPVYDSETEAHPLWAKVTVYKLVGGQRCAFTATARWSEYAQTFYDKETRSEKLGDMWQRMPYLMLGKCAEALALRKAFPQDLSGLYTHDEMQQAGAQSDAVTQDINEPADTARNAPATLSPAIMRDKVNEVLADLGKDPQARREWWDALSARLEGEPTVRDLRHQLLYLEKRLKSRQNAPESTITIQGDSVIDPSIPTEPVTSQAPFWRDILIAHGTNPKLPKGLRDQIGLVTDKTLDSRGLELAGAVMDWVDQADKGAA